VWEGYRHPPTVGDVKHPNRARLLERVVGDGRRDTLSEPIFSFPLLFDREVRPSFSPFSSSSLQELNEALFPPFPSG